MAEIETLEARLVGALDRMRAAHLTLREAAVAAALRAEAAEAARDALTSGPGSAAAPQVEAVPQAEAGPQAGAGGAVAAGMAGADAVSAAPAEEGESAAPAPVAAFPGRAGSGAAPEAGVAAAEGAGDSDEGGAIEAGGARAQVEPAPVAEPVAEPDAASDAEPDPGDGQPDEAEAMARAGADLQRMAERADLEAMQSRLSDLEGICDRLRLSNAQLRDNNAALRRAHSAGVGDAALINSGLAAEVEGLRATRAADRAEVDAILAALAPITTPRRPAPAKERSNA